MNENLGHILNEQLLNASTMKGQELFDGIVTAIQKATDCQMCSLWSINNNNTNGGFKSTSLIVRKLKNNIEYPTHKTEDFVHDLIGDCFINYVLMKTTETQLPYYLCDINDCKDHRSKEALEQLKLKYFISIPIPNQENKTIALLKLSFIDNHGINQSELQSIATTISDVLSSCFFRYMLYNKHQLMEALVSNYQNKGAESNLEEIFNPVLTDILRNYCKYEGASMFIWDSYNNRYKLLATTGIKNINSKIDFQTVFYQVGEGLTGKVADTKASKIYDNLDEDECNNPDYKHKFREITTHPGKTMMVIPIFRPSQKDEIIGILRFINKQNDINSDIVDYYNDADEEIMNYASKYLALTIDYFLGEEERNNFISKLSHEFSTPANTIRITADRLLKNKEDLLFVERNFQPYLDAILSSAELQIQQATTNLYISKTRINIPKSQKYTISKTSIKEILNKGKMTVIPIVREIGQGLKFDNIVIDPNIPMWHLYIDEIAFTTVFYNLLTNTIKYRNNNLDFYVNISGYETSDNFIINVSDYGLGIAPKDNNKIFLLGFRGEKVTKKNVNGFGIGLPVVKHIINDFGGEIKVANFRSPTKFEIKLPKYLSNDNYSKTEIWNSK
jgi:signal transduction histidine kinase